MYLKSLELVGFKSFADKTRLEFEPGMTAIVGPNGCGKSNVADAVRWVLGEQSAKALRGSKMEDVIFNGTDAHKPLGMAEVSLTLADCEAALGTEFNEVTITRRVFRSGEGQYFINKAPCRLKDIQRLFMDTGIGTNAYSLMEQGRIDKILSSHPEDRRAVFEEASGITKYKADRREAMRKLEQTEANLLRLDDIIREVKRQIISLQRQAGKARRYQEIQGQLRSLDLFSTADRLQVLDAEIQTLTTRLAGLREQDEAARAEIAIAEQREGAIRDAVEQIEAAIARTMEAAVAARTELQRVQELSRTNRDRIVELQALSERDTRDADEAKARRGQHQANYDEQAAKLERARSDRDAAARDLESHAKILAEAESAVEEASRQIHRLRTEQVELDSRLAQLQNELSAIDAEERTNILRRERLAAEQAEAQRVLGVFDGRLGDMAARVAELRASADAALSQVALLETQRADKQAAVATLQRTLSELRSNAAARSARIDLLLEGRREHEGFGDGAKHLLRSPSDLGIDPARVLGPLAEQIRIAPPFQRALEAALRPWLDAIAVDSQQTAVDILREMHRRSLGSVRLLAVPAPGAPASVPDGARRLVDLIDTRDDLRSSLVSIIGHVVVVDSADQIPCPVPAGIAYVTTDGLLIGGNGAAELWVHEDAAGNPLAREQWIASWQAELALIEQQRATHEQSLADLQREETTVGGAMAEARRNLEEARRQLNLAEGEHTAIAQELHQANERFETVSWELGTIEKQHSTGDERRARITTDMETVRGRQAEIRATVASLTEQMRDLDQRRSRVMSEVGDRRVRFSELRQAAESLSASNLQLAARIQELDALIADRARGVSSYQERIAALRTAIADADARVAPLAEQAAKETAALAEAKARREQMAAELHAVQADLRVRRDGLERLRGQRSQAEIELAQQQMRRQNLVDRVTSEYRITIDQITGAPEPEWENGVRPERDTIETQIAELRAKLEAMGPVNLVAIEEHRELEERYAFLSTQQQDLVNSKQQLMDFIKEINKTTTEMFAQTFEKVNTNFQEMFTKLFGGGSAKLVLVDEGDVLESGIEIIARPPGKKLQTVSLLSGGERTMTAVALLFALYQVKPSPFCVLDELDAALDDANIGRFVKTVQGFIENSQFVVITHNRQTIAAARMLYGVTMEQQGVSKIVSVKFSETQTREDRYPPQPTETAPAAG